ncbi:MAG: 2-dehydropantoate 2-reductase [Gloeobacteraceae cyanobacterium ES-bin-144]|nr:2-dehydropantoate 2-reductase [Verrucomicrobiales bacterium]
MSWTFKSVAVVGSGAVGLYYGGRLTAAGNDVRFLIRSDFDTISRGGLKVESVHGDFEIPRVMAFKTTGEIGTVDLVIVAWKATANHQLAEILPPLLHAETQVLTLQNGLGNCECIEKIVGPDRVLGGLCFVCINRISPGFVKHSAGGRVAIGEWQPAIEGRAAEIARCFKAAGIHAVATENLQQAQWEKLIWNIPFNGLSVAEGGVTTDVLLASAEMEHEIRALMSEVIAAAHALGIELDDDLIDSNIERTRPMGPYRTSSMVDFIEGREVELGPIWQEPLRRAKAVGVDVSHMEQLYQKIERRIASRRLSDFTPPQAASGNS